MKDRYLRKDLLAEGASTNEAENLVRLAQQLQNVKPRGLSARAKQRIYDELPVNVRQERRPVFRWAIAGSLAGAMALLAIVTQVVLPGGNTAKPNSDEIKTLIQPTESVLQELDMKVEELKQQDTVDEAQLHEAENKYQRTFDDFKKKYEKNEKFKNYDWNKWRRDWLNRNGSQSGDQNSRVNGASITNSPGFRYDTFRDRQGGHD